MKGNTDGGANGGAIALLTGQTVAVPLETEATMAGAVLPASHARVRKLLPPGLAPIRVAPGRAAVAFLCVEYRWIGDGAIEPYDEFGVVVPARGPTARPGRGVRGLLSEFLGGIGGYVRYLPVTTDAGRALGVEGWGYPKEVARISFEDAGSRRRTTVAIGGDRLLTLGIDRPRPAFDLSVGASSYTFAGGLLRRQPLSFDGEVGVRPLDGRASCSFGDHPRARRLRALELGRRALVVFHATGEFVVGPGRAVGETA